MNQQILEKKIGNALISGFTEKGNNYFVSECQENIVLFKKIDEQHYIQIARTAQNYPSLDIGVVELTDEELTKHIYENLNGWYCVKTQLNINTDSDKCVDAPES